MSTITASELHTIMARDKKMFEAAVKQSQAAAKASGSQISAEAFWWGFHIVIPEGPLKQMETASDISKVVSGAIGVGFGVAGVPPVAVCIGIIVAVWGVESIAIKAADHGKGVYLSWLWPQVPLAVVPPYIQSLPLPTAI